MVALLAALVLSLFTSPAQANPLAFGLPVAENTCYHGCSFNGLGCYEPDFYHTAQDYIPNEGQGPLEVLATADGVVTAIFPNSEGHGMGNALLLRHLLRSGGEIFSLYGHLKSFAPGLQVGDEVLKGEAIGLMGQSGFGDPYYWNRHLHFELKSAPTLGDPVSETYEGYTPSPAQNWGYFNPADYIEKVEFVPLIPEEVSSPAPPLGPTSVSMYEEAWFRSGGAACNYGHWVQYYFDWGDTTGSGWLAKPEASHAWTAEGVYTVSVRARCAAHPEVVSEAATAQVEVLYASAPPPGEDGGGGCFIATAAWGTADCKQVVCLRRVRDEYLAPSRAGRWLIGCYYRLSPPAARLLAASRPRLRALVRGMLWPLAWAAGAWLRLGTALGWLGVLGLGWLARGLLAERR